MQYRFLALLAVAGSALAQRPENTSICDYYTTALLKDNNATNQYTLLTLLVNTVVIGNYTKPNVGVKVPGILAPGKHDNTSVNLLPYFDGALYSTNQGGNAGVSVNFLDDGGAVPLAMNKPANGTESNQYKLLTHLYEFFGVLLGCSQVNKTGFPAYTGENSQYKVHKFMNLDANQVGYFIAQVGLAAQSFGVAKEDIDVVAGALNKLFGYKCAPETTVIPSQGAQLQSICQADSCPLSPNDTCSAYANSFEPGVANATLAMGQGNATANGSTTATSTSSGKGSATASATGSPKGNTGTVVGISLAALGAAVFALAL